MKKLIITTAIILGLGLTTFAQNDNNGGLFLRGAEMDESSSRETTPTLILPSQHGETGDQGAPVGSGIAVLMGLGAAYLVAQRRKEK